MFQHRPTAHLHQQNSLVPRRKVYLWWLARHVRDDFLPGIWMSFLGLCWWSDVPWCDSGMQFGTWSYGLRFHLKGRKQKLERMGINLSGLSVIPDIYRLSTTTYLSSGLSSVCCTLKRDIVILDDLSSAVTVLCQSNSNSSDLLATNPRQSWLHLCGAIIEQGTYSVRIELHYWNNFFYL